MRCILVMWDANHATISIWGVGDAAPAYQSGSHCPPQVATTCLERLNQGMITSFYAHTHTHLLEHTKKAAMHCDSEPTKPIVYAWVKRGVNDFKPYKLFKYWSLSEIVVVGAMPHRWPSARQRAKAYRFVKREKRGMSEIVKILRV